LGSCTNQSYNFGEQGINEIVISGILFSVVYATGEGKNNPPILLNSTEITSIQYDEEPVSNHNVREAYTISSHPEPGKT